jgi:hemerythrin-like domain-containing protein
MCDHCGCRAFPPIAELTAEHETILDLAWRLSETHGAGGTPHADVRRELLDLLERHVTKEETGLYPVILSTGGFSDDKVNALEAEHRDIHRSLTEGGFDRRDFYALAAHIEDEEMELFPIAMLRFDDDEWAATDHAHRTVEAEPTTAVP